MANRYIIFCVPILFLAAACASAPVGPGDHSSPSLALVGEWRMTDGSGRVAFSPDGSYSFVDPAGGRGQARYTVLEEDGERRTVSTLIRLVEFEGDPVEEVVEVRIEGRFSPNYRLFVGEVIDEEGVTLDAFRMER